MDRKYAFAALPLLAAVLAAPCISNAADAPDKPVLVHMQAALDIDRNGRVAAVEFIDDKKLPDAIRQQAQQNALSWKFQPPMKAGQPVSGRTYARMQACLVPSGDGIDVSFAYTSNGPGSIHVPRKIGKSVAMPIPKLVAEGVNHIKGKMIYVVSTDGTATLESATLDDPDLQRKYGHLWQIDQRELLRQFRYRPELIDGVATATRVETVAENAWFRHADRKAVLAEMDAQDIEESDACRALRSDDGRQLASDSPFKRIDS